MDDGSGLRLADGGVRQLQAVTGNSVVEWPNGDGSQPNTNFSGQFWDPGYYIVEVIASVRYHDDTAGADVATHYGYGYLGGTYSDIFPSGGTTPQVIASGGVHAEDAGGGTGNDGMPVKAPTLEIDVNNTSAANDDMVRLASQTPQRSFWVPCQLKLDYAQQGQQAIAATVTDQAGAVAFSTTDPSNLPGSGYVDGPAASVSSLTLTVPGDGSPVSFWITGVTGSSNVGDDSIQASSTSPGGIQSATQPVTVFWFKNATMTTAPGKHYIVITDGDARISGQYSAVLTPPDGEGMYFSATATLQPAGLSTSAPQLKKLMLGMEQNINTATEVTTYGGLTQASILWNDNEAQAEMAAQNGPVSVNCPMTRTNLQYPITAWTNDTVPDKADDPSNIPFYDRSRLKTLGNDYTDQDAPYYVANPPLASHRYLIYGTRNKQKYLLATVTYKLTQMSMSAIFRDYCTIADSQNAGKGQTQWLAEGT